MLISIIIPCYNEAAVLPEAHRRLAEFADRLPSAGTFEFIFVDDGSRDETSRLLYELASADPRVRGLRLSRNFGQQIATTAGLEHAAGDAVVIIDADLQDPPELIETMIARWQEGYHVLRATNRAHGRDGIQTLERESFLSPRPGHLARGHSERHGRLPSHGPAGGQRAFAHAGAGPFPAGDGQLGRLSANRRAL
jgi:glycosyltransferase involved in cell wall biosynthesis